MWCCISGASPPRSPRSGHKRNRACGRLSDTTRSPSENGTAESGSQCQALGLFIVAIDTELNPSREIGFKPASKSESSQSCNRRSRSVYRVVGVARQLDRDRPVERDRPQLPENRRPIEVAVPDRQVLVAAGLRIVGVDDREIAAAA